VVPGDATNSAGPTVADLRSSYVLLGGQPGVFDAAVRAVGDGGDGLLQPLQEKSLRDALATSATVMAGFNAAAAELLFKASAPQTGWFRDCARAVGIEDPIALSVQDCVDIDNQFIASVAAMQRACGGFVDIAVAEMLMCRAIAVVTGRAGH
jgi:hypothetical protein